MILPFAEHKTHKTRTHTVNASDAKRREKKSREEIERKWNFDVV